MAILVVTPQSIARLKAAAVPGAPSLEVHDRLQRNLVLRCGPRGVRWGLRLSIKGRSTRLDLGDVDEWRIREAREIGGEANRLLRNGLAVPDRAWLLSKRIEYGKVDPALVKPLPRRRGWTFAEARELYLQEVRRTLRPATYDDYRGMLNIAELRPLADTPVADIDRQQMSKIIQAIHRSGRETHAHHLAAVIRPMWAWLAGDNQVADSGVAVDAMAQLRAPPRTLDELAEDGYVPPMEELGRIVALARMRVLAPAISDAVELLVFTAQRRLTVVSARKQDFTPVSGGALWQIPSAFMKSRRKRRKGRYFHVVPLPPQLWKVVKRAMRDSIDPESEWLFPQYRPRRAGGELGHMSASTLTRAFLLMPTVVASPHDVRRAFGTHGEAKLGWARLHTKAILDHGEGEDGSDVTAMHYALHHGAHHKWETMKKWVKAVEAEIARALAADPHLDDPVWAKAQLDAGRYQHRT